MHQESEDRLFQSLDLLISLQRQTNKTLNSIHAGIRVLVGIVGTLGIQHYW